MRLNEFQSFCHFICIPRQIVGVSSEAYIYIPPVLTGDHIRASWFPRDSIRTEMTNTIEKINIDNIETRIYSGLRTNLLIMISTTRNQRAGLIPHLLTSGLIPSLLTSIS
jgi:hypothetical protein